MILVKCPDTFQVCFLRVEPCIFIGAGGTDGRDKEERDNETNLERKKIRCLGAKKVDYVIPEVDNEKTQVFYDPCCKCVFILSIFTKGFSPELYQGAGT